MSIQGETLGAKHKLFNKLSDQKHYQELENIDYSQSDVENLLKIDNACRNRNVDFILKVFKCEDMLYVSRAIKQTLWLIQDPQYSQIINPHYLHNELLPYMLTEARNKLLLHIRLHLKDFNRNEKFFIYLVDINLTTAMKWLPNCSATFITSRLEQNIYRIPENILLRLLWVTIDPLRVYVKSMYWKKPMLQKAMFTICIYGEEYFNILDSVENHQLPLFNAKYTKLAMKKCPQCIINNFNRYEHIIDTKTFAKYLIKEHYHSFLIKYPEKGNVLFSDGKHESILKSNNHEDLLGRLSQCDPNNNEDVKRLLKDFHDVDLLNAQKKKILQFLHGVINKFETFKFTEETWTVLNDIFIKSGVYNENKKHFEAFKKSIIVYHVLNDKAIPETIHKDFMISVRYKSEQKKLNKLEKKKLFKFLYTIAEKHLDVCEDVTECLERLLSLLKDWGENWQNYPTIVNKIEVLVQSMKASSNIEALTILYNRNQVWRKVLFNESFLIKCDEVTCLNVLKHNPNLLEQNKEAVINLCLDKPMKRFCTKLRMFWSDSIGEDYKRDLLKRFNAQPSKGLFALLSQKEAECMICNEEAFEIHKKINITLPQFVAKNMYRTRPKPSMQLVLSYGKGMSLQDSMASIKSVLQCMPAIKTIDCIKLQKWPEFVEKLYVLQAFTKFDNEDRNKLVLSIWNNTKYSSVRADIFKMSYNYLKDFHNNDMNGSDNYNSSIEKEWAHLKCLMESLTDRESVIVYNLLSKFERVPLLVRTEYCIIGYKFLKQLPSRLNCQRFMNNIVSKIDYNKVLPTLEIDFLAEMVHDTIIPRLWTQKLDWSFTNMLYTSVTRDTDEKTIEAFEKILLPVLDEAFKMWNIQIKGLFMVRYNVYDLINKINSSYKDMLLSNNSTLLNLVLDSFNRNLPIQENYVVITNFKLAAEYLKVLSKYDDWSASYLHGKTAIQLSEICVKMFCDDVRTFSDGIWRPFFEAWKMVVNGFGLKKSTQNKVNNHILDLAKHLSPDLDILLNIFVLEQIYFTDYTDEDKIGRKGLRARIAAHPSKEVKSQSSKMIIIDNCAIPHFPYFYVLSK